MRWDKMRLYKMKWDTIMRWNEWGWDGIWWHEIMRWDVMGWDKMRWDTLRWDEMMIVENKQQLRTINTQRALDRPHNETLRCTNENTRVPDINRERHNNDIKEIIIHQTRKNSVLLFYVGLREIAEISCQQSSMIRRLKIQPLHWLTCW